MSKFKLTKIYVNNVINELKIHYPNTKPSLNYKNNYELIIAVILSAQCTDARVNIVTKELFKKYPTPYDLANSDINELMILVKSTGFYRAKAANIKETARLIVDKFNGNVPDNMPDLLTLKGVARKTANIVLYHGMGITSGIAVDTHVKRLSNKFKFVNSNDPKKIEIELMKLLPKDLWGDITDLMIYHGRSLCKAPTPKCNECFLNNKCPSSNI